MLASGIRGSSVGARRLAVTAWAQIIPHRPHYDAKPRKSQLVAHLGLPGRAFSSQEEATLNGTVVADEVVLNRSDPSSAGSIEIIVGPMFAGKTSELLRRISAFEAAASRVIAVKSNKDVRYGIGNLRTHDGRSRACFAVSTLSQLRLEWPSEYNEAQVIAIDEAQFFPDLLEFCTAAADQDDKQVIVAGLDGDFRRQRFGQVLDLLPQADSVTKLASRCSYCEAAGFERAALFSLRIAADERQEVVGGADKYAPVCRHHYNALSKLREVDDKALAAVDQSLLTGSQKASTV